MLSNYFTFFHIAQALNNRYTGIVIAEVYSQEKNTLSIVLYTPEPHTITISCVARQNCIVARAGVMRSKNNSVDLFTSLINAHLQSVFMSTDDRVVYFTLSDNTVLCAEMFGAKANVVLCDVNGNVADVFLEKKKILSSIRSIQSEPKQVTVSDFLPGRDEMALLLQNELPVVKSLKKIVPKLGATLVREVLFRTEIPEHTPGSELTPQHVRTLHSTIGELISELLLLKTVSPLIYFEEQSPVCFSLIALRHLSSLRMETYPDLFTGIQKFVGVSRSVSFFHKKKEEITSWLQRELDRTVRTISNIKKDAEESSRAEQYELFAQLILLHLHRLTKGMQSVDLENLFSTSETVTIPLDRSLSPAQNAERYFNKAKRSKIGRTEAQKRQYLLENRRNEIEATLQKTNTIIDSISLKNFLLSYGDQLKQLGFMTEKEAEDLPPFKIFIVEGGFTVYAGKSSENNDVLTLKHSKPNDLWFHARGSSGSHVVLKIGSAGGLPSKKAIEQAASIAAYYSKMKNAKHVPVAMTEKKYVRKPKGAPPGTVVIDKEKVIFVKPKLPVENSTR